MRNKNVDQKIENITSNLVIQIEKILDHCNEKSFKTRYRYFEATERFCSFLASEFRLQKFENVKSKHLVAYVEHMKEHGYSASTIKTDLSGIHFFHLHSNSKNILISNSDLNLDKRKIGNEDRAWTQTEIEKASTLAKQMGRLDIFHAIKLSVSFGLRLEEVCKCQVLHLKQALENSELYVKGKNGQVRYIPITDLEQISVIRNAIEYANSLKRRGSDKVLVEAVKHGTLSAKRSIQNWITNHRGKFENNNRWSDNDQRNKIGLKARRTSVSFHGLRHSYSQKRYREEILDRSERDARKRVSEELGHHRESVVKIYLDKKSKRS